MPKYCIENFENADGAKMKVYWEQTKHVHDAGFITTIKKRLGAKFGGNWEVNINSYQANQPRPTNPNAIDYGDL